jgi:N utilization substance protein A
MDLKDFSSALSQIVEEKGLPPEKIIETIEQALAAAYKKDYGKKGQNIKAKLNPVSGQVDFWQIKLVVDKDMIYSEEELEELKEKQSLPEEESEREQEPGKKVRFNQEKHIMIEDAKKKKPKIKTGEELIIPLKEQKDYGRIAAQTAKQVIMQRIREAEKTSIFEEFKSKEGQIVSGVVQRIEGRNVLLDIGKTLGVLTREEQVPGEFYRSGQRLKVFVLKVEETAKGPKIFLSRAYPKLVSKLFELEVPEISTGSVVIKSIAREVGSRTKIAVASTEESIDPIGAAVGQRGTRVQVVINELGGEKIDIIEYSDDPKKYIANSLSPAKVLEVKILPKNKALTIVPEDQLSLAIGKEGQNVRLAAKLTGWKIDVRGPGSKEEMEDVGDDGSDGNVVDVEKEEVKDKKGTKKEKKEKNEKKEAIVGDDGSDKIDGDVKKEEMKKNKEKK